RRNLTIPTGTNSSWCAPTCMWRGAETRSRRLRWILSISSGVLAAPLHQNYRTGRISGPDAPESRAWSLDLCRSEIGQYCLVLGVFLVEPLARALRIRVALVPEVVDEILLPLVGFHHRRQHLVPVGDLRGGHAPGAHQAAPARGIGR